MVNSNNNIDIPRNRYNLPSHLLSYIFLLLLFSPYCSSQPCTINTIYTVATAVLYSPLYVSIQRLCVMYTVYTGTADYPPFPPHPLPPLLLSSLQEGEKERGQIERNKKWPLQRRKKGKKGGTIKLRNAEILLLLLPLYSCYLH